MFKKSKPISPWVVRDNKKKVFECIICLESFSTTKEPAFDTGECDHKICQDCLRDYIWGVLTNITYKDYVFIQCPGTSCKKQYQAEEVVNVIFTQDEAMEWWSSALCSKAYISNKVFCPHPGCTGVFDAEDDHTKQCTFSECFQCHKGLCITCQTVWHPDEIKVRDESISLKETLHTAQQKKWCKCPYCFNFVERSAGCESIMCRCGKYFCYTCGGKMTGFASCFNKCHTKDPKQVAELRKSMYDKPTNAKK